MTMKKQNTRTLTLVVLTLTYLIIGGAVFDRLESTHELNENNKLSETVDRFKRKHGMNESEFEKVRWILS